MKNSNKDVFIGEEVLKIAESQEQVFDSKEKLQKIRPRINLHMS